MSIVFKIEAYLGRKPDFIEEIKLRNDGSGDYISEWNITSEKAKPTDEQLNALSSQATALENNAKIDAKRRTEYLSWQEQLDKLYHDINDGKLDKTGSWYKHIKAGKDANSKG